MPKSNEGSTSQDIDAEDDDNEGDVAPVTVKKGEDDKMAVKLPKGPRDPQVQQMIIA